MGNLMNLIGFSGRYSSMGLIAYIISKITDSFETAN
jgi:hypothetical protein